MIGRSLRLGLVLVAAVACTSASTSAPPAPSSTTPPPASASTGAESEPAKHEPRATTRRDGSGRCDPEPKEGDPCAEGDSWCVLSWGEPGGSSSALWCRDGRWEREEEANLPAEH